ncbi:glutathione peroxidase [bacterium (Candidatus Blackallbacteria) CG17_big_fil_post_rev_8_21_14_2_50_48_46]|uniref:Glutathione peroxidase n=1 Tax=bacterium (Candidatus Blackallbacteria) CG17_big_fil_post_rev_8_21_14_2_50_48_46 TaxID=2014261 RepID=A0A2M7FZ54_9BACT|nr:MAG: glutathione peroxidase [bacterium (Candidatus Blackallbacteria) CG18_big_fil_WC_8_21_14_2_50_49_26]PIW14385.1 MAG: glutathione peroxidase [bacterium (Candidatus Blackallbacteria) CG17_big_fil_post_rev_8_21_14_2_50_48_46]PIW46892.1 MAG: glutathione peroxidase [bacterium (Candidatus Blackallbacteria) CG13_big_fil_rev_8_21_14_2_50_49_14]
MSASVYDFEVKTITGETTTLEPYRNKVLVIVNTASKCGLTPQYEGLEKLYRSYREQGLEILGFPCNQFGLQEPGSEAEIQSFCQLNFKVDFPMFSKIEVNGSDTHPLYAYLKDEAPGLLGSKPIKWNFTKFLVNREGKVLKRFAPTDTPESMESEIKRALKK